MHTLQLEALTLAADSVDLTQTLKVLRPKHDRNPDSDIGAFLTRIELAGL